MAAESRREGFARGVPRPRLIFLSAPLAPHPNADCAQLLPPSAETSTLLIRPFPEKAMPEIS